MDQEPDLLKDDAFPWHTVWSVCTYQIEEQSTADGTPVRVIVPIQGSRIKTYSALWRPNLASGAPQRQRQDEPGRGPHEDLAGLDDLCNEDEILRFVNTHGLLGLWDVPQYAQWQIFGDPHSRYHEDPFGGSSSTWYGGRGWYNSQEPVAAFQKAAWHYQQWVEKLIAFDNLAEKEQRLTAEQEIVDGFDAGAPPRHTITDNINPQAPGFSVLIGDAVCPRMVWDEKNASWLFGWQYRSLLHAIYFATFLDTMERKDRAGGFRQCQSQTCRRLYLAAKNTQKYCSRTCEKAQTMRNLRKDQSTVLRLHKEDLPLEHIAKEVGRNIDVVKRWIHKANSPV